MHRHSRINLVIKTCFERHWDVFFYAKFMLVILHRNTLPTKKKDNNVSVFYYEESSVGDISACRNNFKTAV